MTLISQKGGLINFKMDSISSYEFHKIFNRVTDYIDLQGKLSEGEIEKELVKASKKCRRLRRKAETAQERAKLKRAAIGYDRLIEYDFPRRVIREAIMDPKGLVSMTLRYGKKEAKRRILAQKRAQIRSRLGRRHWR